MSIDLCLPCSPEQLQYISTVYSGRPDILSKSLFMVAVAYIYPDRTRISHGLATSLCRTSLQSDTLVLFSYIIDLMRATSVDASSSFDLGDKGKGLAEELASLDFPGIRHLISKQPYRTPETFQTLIRTRLFSAAVEYEYRDGCCLDQSLLIGAFSSIVEVLR